MGGGRGNTTVCQAGRRREQRDERGTAHAGRRLAFVPRPSIMVLSLHAMRDEGPAMAIDHDVTLLSNRRTKIVATLGPISSDEETIGRLIEAGADVFRLNMSHGDHAGHRRIFDYARRAIEAAGRAIPILADLAGPKIRVGDFERGEIELVRGASVTLTTRDVPGRDALIPSQYEGLAGDVSQGDPILLADGTLELEVQAVDETEIHCLVTRGGRLKDRKGINLPGSTLSAPCFTDKDRGKCLGRSTTKT